MLLGNLKSEQLHASQKSFWLPKPSDALNLDRCRSVCLQPQAKRVAINLWQKKSAWLPSTADVCREKPKTLSLWHALCEQSLHSTYLASVVGAAHPELLTLLEDRPGTKAIKSIGCECEMGKLCNVHKVQHKTRWLLLIISCADILYIHHHRRYSAIQFPQGHRHSTREDMIHDIYT